MFRVLEQIVAVKVVEREDERVCVVECVGAANLELEDEGVLRVL